MFENRINERNAKQQRKTRRRNFRLLCSFIFPLGIIVIVSHFHFHFSFCVFCAFLSRCVLCAFPLVCPIFWFWFYFRLRFFLFMLFTTTQSPSPSITQYRVKQTKRTNNQTIDDESMVPAILWKWKYFPFHSLWLRIHSEFNSESKVKVFHLFILTEESNRNS